MNLSEAGEIAHRCLLEIPIHFPHVTIDAAVVMPDHVHAILVIQTAATANPTDFPNGPNDVPNVSVPNADVSNVGIGHARSLQPQQRQQQRSDPDRQRTRPLETLPLAVGTFKSSVTRLVRASGISAFRWQKSYHDRIIRDGMEYDRIFAYILNNPRRWSENIRTNISQTPFQTFPFQTPPFQRPPFQT